MKYNMTSSEWWRESFASFHKNKKTRKINIIKDAFSISRHLLPYITQERNNGLLSLITEPGAKIFQILDQIKQSENGLEYYKDTEKRRWYMNRINEHIFPNFLSKNDTSSCNEIDPIILNNLNINIEPLEISSSYWFIILCVIGFGGLLIQSYFLWIHKQKIDRRDSPDATRPLLEFNHKSIEEDQNIFSSNRLSSIEAVKNSLLRKSNTHIQSKTPSQENSSNRPTFLRTSKRRDEDNIFDDGSNKTVIEICTADRFCSSQNQISNYSQDVE